MINAETKYEYNGKNQLVAFTDPEGRRENTYDYRNRLTETVSAPFRKGQEKKTGKETKHTYTYNAYGDVATQGDTVFEYDDASGQVTKETAKLTKNKSRIPCSIRMGQEHEYTK